MNSLFLCSPVSTINFAEDTTPLMIAEVNRRGQAAWFSTLKDISFSGGSFRIKTRRIELQPEEPFYRFFEETERGFEDFEIIHQRMDPPFDLNYYFSTLFLEFAKTSLVVNHPASLRNFNEKLSILLFPDLIAPTIVSSDFARIAGFVAAHGSAVLKPLESCSGRGVIKLESKNMDRSVVMKSTGNGLKPVMVQAFLEEVYEGETRLTLLGGEPLGWMKKIPGPGNFLANFDFGASGKAHEPTREELQVAEALRDFMRTNRLYLTAIDIIGGRISEINLTSPGLLRQTNRVMGKSLERELQDFFEAEYRRLFG